MLYSDTVAEFLSARAGHDEHPQFVLEPLVDADADGTASIGRTLCALLPQGTWLARLGIELDDPSGDEDDVDVGAIDVQSVDRAALAGDVFLDGGCRFTLGAVGGGHCAGMDEVRGEMPLVSVEPAVGALAAMAHLGVFHRHAPVGRNALADPAPAGGIGIDVLVEQLAKRIKGLLQGSALQGLGEIATDELLQGVELGQQGLERFAYLRGVAPVHVEPPLDAAGEEQRGTCLGASLFDGPFDDGRHALDDLARRVPQQVDGVLDLACALRRCRVDGKLQRLAQRLRVEGLGRAGHLDGLLEQPAIHVCVDEPLTEVMKSALRKGWLGGPEAVEDHLPAQIHQRQLESLGIRGADVSLQQDDYGHHGRRYRGLTCTRRAVHLSSSSWNSSVKISCRYSRRKWNSLRVRTSRRIRNSSCLVSSRLGIHRSNAIRHLLCSRSSRRYGIAEGLLYKEICI